MSNERTVCRVIAEYLSPDAQLEWPETEANGEVDLRVKGFGIWYSIEHTLVEPFQGDKSGNELFRILTNKIRDHVTNSSYPNGRLVAKIPLNVSETPLGKRLDAEVKTFASQIEKFFEEMKFSGNGEMGAGSNGVSLIPVEWLEEKIYLDFYPSSEQFSIEFVRVKNGDPSLERVVVLRRLLSNKLPKLLRAKVTGDQTVLALEFNDIAFSSVVDIEKCLHLVLEERNEAVDYAFAVDTTGEGEYIVWPLIPKGEPRCVESRRP